MANIPLSIRLGILVLLLWAMLIAVVGWVRPLYASNEEMHYASIAWEMWRHHSFILPIQGGKPYAEKGPLLFWLIHAGWWLFGVSSWWLRLAPELFGLACLFLLRLFALRVWPNEKKIADLAPLILLGSVVWAAKIPVMRFDVITTFFVLLSLYALISAVEVNRKYWLLMAVSISLGLLVKGPVLFLFILPAAFTVKWWIKADKLFCGYKNYLYMIGAFLLGLLMPLMWLIPAIAQGGEQYGYALLFSRSVARIWGTQTNLHQNYSYYFFVLAMMLLPWIIWPPFWRSLWCGYRQKISPQAARGLRLLLIIAGCAFVFLTGITEKGPRYLLPALPFVILLMTYFMVTYAPSLRRWHQLPIAIIYIAMGFFYALFPHFMSASLAAKYPWLLHMSPLWGYCCVAIGIFWLCWRAKDFTEIVIGLSVTTVLFWTCYNLGITKAQAAYNDWRPLAQQIAKLQAQGAPVAFLGLYQELEFFGRLDRPLELVGDSNLTQWAQQHANGWVVVRDRSISPVQLQLLSSETIISGSH